MKVLRSVLCLFFLSQLIAACGGAIENEVVVDDGNDNSSQPEQTNPGSTDGNQVESPNEDSSDDQGETPSDGGSGNSGSQTGGGSGTPQVNPNFSGDATSGQALFVQQCNICHVDQFDGTFDRGLYAFDMNDLDYPSDPDFAQYSADTVEGLSLFIDENMPSSGACTGQCADDIAAYLWTYVNQGTPQDANAGTDEPGDTAPQSCDNDIMAPQLRRLSELQIQNSIVDTFGNYFDDSIWPNMEDGSNLIGMDTTADRLSVNVINLERFYGTSRGIVDTLLNNHDDITNCAIADSDFCVEELLYEYGLHLWRRPISSAEAMSIMNTLDDLTENEDKLELMLNSLLLSSNFLYRSELGVTQDNINVLSNFEIASLLSYSLWNSKPDTTLLEAAMSSEPFTEAQIVAQIDRMIEDPKTDEALMHVYTDYLKLKLVLTREKSAELQFTNDVREAVLESAERSITDKIALNSNYMNVFEGNQYYVNSDIDYLFNMNLGILNSPMDKI